MAEKHFMKLFTLMSPAAEKKVAKLKTSRLRNAVIRPGIELGASRKKHSKLLRGKCYVIAAAFVTFRPTCLIIIFYLNLVI